MQPPPLTVYCSSHPGTIPLAGRGEGGRELLVLKLTPINQERGGGEKKKVAFFIYYVGSSLACLSFRGLMSHNPADLYVRTTDHYGDVFPRCDGGRSVLANL